MKLRDFIRDQFKRRLDAAGCLVVHDGEGRCRDRATAQARKTRLVMVAGHGIITACGHSAGQARCFPPT